MHPVFTKPLSLVTAADLDDLCRRRWPEGQLVEFKGALPAKDGRDKWYEGADCLGTRARDELLEEIVAFANSQGGTLLLGIRQLPGNPPHAESIQAVPRCHDLARRLEDVAREVIDPPLPIIDLGAVEISDGGGVVIWRELGLRSRRSASRRPRTS
jgi:Putative DNA-binding domain